MPVKNVGYRAFFETLFVIVSISSGPAHLGAACSCTALTPSTGSTVTVDPEHGIPTIANTVASGTTQFCHPPLSLFVDAAMGRTAKTPPTIHNR